MRGVASADEWEVLRYMLLCTKQQCATTRHASHCMWQPGFQPAVFFPLHTGKQAVLLSRWHHLMIPCSTAWESVLEEHSSGTCVRMPCLWNTTGRLPGSGMCRPCCSKCQEVQLGALPWRPSSLQTLSYCAAGFDQLNRRRSPKAVYIYCPQRTPQGNETFDEERWSRVLHMFGRCFAARAGFCCIGELPARCVTVINASALCVHQVTCCLAPSLPVPVNFSPHAFCAHHTGVPAAYPCGQPANVMAPPAGLMTPLIAAVAALLLATAPLPSTAQPSTPPSLPPPAIPYTSLVFTTPISAVSAQLTRLPNTLSQCGTQTCVFQPQNQLLSADLQLKPPTNWWWSGYTHAQQVLGGEAQAGLQPVRGYCMRARPGRRWCTGNR